MPQARERETEIHVERRLSPRAPLMIRVDYYTVDALFSEFTRNVNEGGMFIETDNPAELESTVTLSFRLPGSDEPIKVGGRVVHVSDGAGPEPAGMGVEFDNLDTDAQARIDALVQSLRRRPA